MTWNHEPENHLSPSEIPSHCSSDPAGPAPEAPQAVPFFATQDAFLQAVYDHWSYFTRCLLKWYRVSGHGGGRGSIGLAKRGTRSQGLS